MKMEELLVIVGEIMNLLNSKKISPDDAVAISYILSARIKELNEKAQKEFMNTSIFSGSPPVK